MYFCSSLMSEEVEPLKVTIPTPFKTRFFWRKKKIKWAFFEIHSGSLILLLVRT